ncbi:MAG: MFS transporter [Gemmataceae bacterium]
MTNSPDPQTDAPPSSWRWGVCGLLLLATTLNYMDRVALNQSSVRISQALRLDNVEYGSLESVFSLAFAVGTLVTGWLVDRAGVRWIYPLAVAGWSLAGFCTGFANTFAVLLICRCSLGFFEAANWPCGVRTVREAMPPAERSLGNSLFQSGTAIGAIITPLIILLCMQYADPHESERLATVAVAGGAVVNVVGLPAESTWRLPFLAIGLLGFVWVFAWFLLPKGLFDRKSNSPVSASSIASFSSVFRDRRFFILIAVIVGVNFAWHTFRIWLPKYLVHAGGYSEAAMLKFSTLFYISADVGTWTVGLATLFLARRGFPLHSVRVAAFAGCTGLVLLSTMVVWVRQEWLLPVLLLAVGFGSLGLFPTYFALSQELSATHQGKVTGTLGFINALVMAAMSAGQGAVIEATKRYDWALSVAGVPALIALMVLVYCWPKERA